MDFPSVLLETFRSTQDKGHWLRSRLGIAKSEHVQDASWLVAQGKPFKDLDESAFEGTRDTQEETDLVSGPECGP